MTNLDTHDTSPEASEKADLVRERDEARAETAETIRLTTMHLDNMTISTKHAEASAEKASAAAAAMRKILEGLGCPACKRQGAEMATAGGCSRDADCDAGWYGIHCDEIATTLSSTAGTDLLKRMERILSDRGILISMLRSMEDATGESLDSEDEGILQEIEADQAALADHPGEKP